MSDNIGRAIRTGKEATLFALNFMPKAKPFTVPAPGGTGTPVMLYPGQRLNDGGVIIGNLDGVHIYVARDGSIYESVAASFVSRTLLLNDVSNRIQRSMWLATLGEAEEEFIFVACATLVGTIGTALAVSEFVCGLVDAYYKHKQEIDLFRQQIQPIARALAEFRTTCPALFNYLILVFIGTAGNAAENVLQGVTARDIAYFAGKFAAYAIKSGGSFTHGLKEAVLWTAAIRSWGIGGRSMEAELEKTAARLRSLGQTAVGREQLLGLTKSSCVLRPEIQRSLKQFTHHLDILARNLGPFLQTISPNM